MPWLDETVRQIRRWSPCPCVPRCAANASISTATRPPSTTVPVCYMVASWWRQSQLAGRGRACRAERSICRAGEPAPRRVAGTLSPVA